MQFLLKTSKNGIMDRTFYVREIITMQKDPLLCPTCEKADRLEENVVLENKSNGKTFYCKRCEALTVVTHLSLRSVELSTKKNDDKIMLKEPHLIRRVEY